MNGSGIECDPVASLDKASFVFGGTQAFFDHGIGPVFDHLRENTYRSRGFGDFWGHLLVARGAAHLMIDPSVKVWDVAALQPIVSEAGGKLTRLDGEPWIDGGGCLTTNGALHDHVLKVIAAKESSGR